MTRDGVRNVGLLEPLDLVVAQLELLGGQRVLEVDLLGRTDDGCGDAFLGQEPSQRNLGHWYAALTCDLGHAVDDVEVGWRRVQELGEGIGLGARGALHDR